MDQTKLKTKLRDAEVLKDVEYAVVALEDYFRERDIDLFWFARKVEASCDREVAIAMENYYKLRTVMDIAGVTTAEELEKLVLLGLQHKEDYQEQLDAILKIKAEMAAAYTNLIKLLP